jgi:hypothetical protein
MASATTSGGDAATTSARRTVQASVLTWSARTTPAIGSPSESATSEG